MKTMICTDSLGYSQENYEAFSNINDVVDRSLEEVSVVPVDVSNECIKLKTAVHNMVELGSFNDGALIAMNIRNAKRILNCPNNSTKVLYLFNLEWMFKEFLYEDLYSVFTNKDLTIVVRSEDYIDPLKKGFGVTPIAVLEEFDLEKLWNSLEETSIKS